MNNGDKPDLEQTRDILRVIEENGDLDTIDAIERRELLMRVGPTVGITSEECESALATAQGADELVQRVRRCVKDGDGRFARALLSSRLHKAQGSRDDVRSVLQEFIDQETVLFFREMAEFELGNVDEMRVIAEREYGFVFGGAGQAGKVILRIGAPEQEAPSDWVLSFEILGPEEEERVESAVHGLDAVQALDRGLQRIAVELRSLQERTGGTLTVFEKEGPGILEAPPERNA
jgi:DUSAM domain-containing protein